MKIYVRAAEDIDIEEWARSDEGQEAQSQYSDIMLKSIQRSLKDCNIEEDVGDTGQDTWIISSLDGDEYTYDFNLNQQLERIQELGAKQAAKEDYREVVDYVRPLLYGNKDMDYFLDWLENDSENSVYKFQSYFFDELANKYPEDRSPSVQVFCTPPNYLYYGHKLEDNVDDVEKEGIPCEIQFYEDYTVKYNFKYEDIYVLGPKKAAYKCAKILYDMVDKDTNIQNMKETKYTEMLDDISDKGGYKKAVKSIISIYHYQDDLYDLSQDFQDIIKYLKDPSPNSVTVKSTISVFDRDKCDKRIDELRKLLKYYEFNVSDVLDVEEQQKHSKYDGHAYNIYYATFKIDY